VQQFPDHSLVIGIEGKLRCVACKHTIPNKWSTIDLHCRMTHKGHPTRHAVNLQAMELRKEDDSELKEELSAYYELHPEEQSGTMMLTDANEVVFRYRVVETILPSGTPLTVVDMFRPLLQRAGFALTDSAHLQVYIPRIEEKEDTKINVEIAGQYLSIAFDGTTRLGEAINIVARFCSESFELKKRLLDFHTLAKHANAVQLAAHTLDVVVRKRNVPASYVVGLSRDSVAVNGAACRRLMVTMTSACDLLCICHTLCHVGARFELTVLDKFMTPWLELVGGRSPHAGAKMLWKESVSPAVVPGYSNVRWYAKAEIIFVIGEAGTRRLRDFLVELENRDYGEATTDKMLEIYNQEGDTLRLQIAAMLDIRILVRTTYEMEGFRLEILLTFHRIQILRALGRSIKNQDDGVLPNVDGVLRVLMTLKKGVRFEKFFHGHGIAVGTLSSEETIASSLYPGQDRPAWLCTYPDGHREHFEEEELRSGKAGPSPAGQDGKPVLIVRHLPERSRICDALVPGFNYLEDRLTGTCDPQYSCVSMLEICRVVRVFDPNFADEGDISSAYVESLQVSLPGPTLPQPPPPPPPTPPPPPPHHTTPHHTTS
jgi:hypothetical protein